MRWITARSVVAGVIYFIPIGYFAVMEAEDGSVEHFGLFDRTAP